MAMSMPAVPRKSALEAIQRKLDDGVHLKALSKDRRSHEIPLDRRDKEEEQRWQEDGPRLRENRE